MNLIYHSNFTIGYRLASTLMTVQGTTEDCLVTLAGLTVMKINTDYKCYSFGRRKTEHQLAIL